jgi:hypothetical protein
MGCKQTTTKNSPSLVLTTAPNKLVYIKSALKKSPVNGKGKTEKLSFLKRQPSIVNKSVNFDEKVRVKLRTPTPNKTRHDNTALSGKVGPKPTPKDDNDDDEDDDELSSISSQEDPYDEQLKTSTISSNPSLQNNQPNGFGSKNNSVPLTSSTNNIKEKTQQLPPVNVTTYPTQNPNIPIGNVFRVRRKIQYSALPQISSSVDPNQSSSIPSYRSTVQTSPPPPPVQRPLPNTNTVLLEHRTSVSNNGSLPQTAYYAFSRRPIDKKTLTEK